MKKGFNHKHDKGNALSAALTQTVELCARHIGHVPLQSVSLYRKQARQNDLHILATEHGHAADNAYLNFFNGTIKGRTIPMTGTSMAPLFNGDMASCYGRSAYRSDQFCYNLRLPQMDALSTYNVQMIFRSKADFSSALCADDVEKLPQIIRDAGMFDPTWNADNQSIDAKSDHVPNHATREALVLYWDVTGYKNILRACGSNAATHFIHKANAALWYDFQENYGCDLLRQEGDGVFWAYPVTGFADQDMRTITELFLQSAQTVLQRYDAVRQAETVPAIRNSFSKIALIRATQIDISAIQSRYAPINLESKGFAYGRLLMDQAPRDKNVIVIDPALKELVAKTDQEFLHHENVMVPKIDFGF